MSTKFNYAQIQGVKGNSFVTDEFIEAVEKIADRLETKPEYLLAAMSFETGGKFNPAIQNFIGATGLIQFLKATAKGLGTTTDKLKAMTAVEQLVFVEKYLTPFKGRIATIEAVYTSILSGSPKKPDDVLFRAGTLAYKQNPLDWNKDGIITAREAATPVAARLFGGIGEIQKKLLELGLVPAELKDRFNDNRWGGDSAKILAEFQKSKGLPETGLIDVETGAALFPETAAPPKINVLKRGDDGDGVKKLQETLVKLGYMTMEKIGGGFGKFGPLTETAVKALQKDLRLAESGEFGDLEETDVKAVLAGIQRDSSATELVKAIQSKLVAFSYLTQAQVDTGFGTFGPQSEKAIKKFQKDNLLQESGVVEEVTFKMLFNEAEASETTESDVFQAQNGVHYDVASDILMTKRLQAKLVEVAELYFKAKGEKLFITSGYRPPERQAPAIYNNIILKGETRVRNTYLNKPAIDQILAAYRANKNEKEKAIAAMTETIAKQVKRGVFISNHLLSNALDVRVKADFVLLGKVAAKVGGRVITEGNHFHMELP
jgi:peptidoglycan hydrolase-like protein with peptidoglycan-binding domain